MPSFLVRMKVLLIFLIDFFEMVLMLFFPGSNSKNGGRMVSCHPRNCLPSPSGHLLPRLFDSSCDGGKIHGSGDSGVGGGGDGACGGGDSVSFLLPTLPALWPALWCLLPARQEIRLPYCLAI